MDRHTIVRPLTVAFILIASLTFVTSGLRAQRRNAAPATAPTIPSPQSVFGFSPGDDRTIIDWKQITEYFARLDKASDRVQVETIGTTTLGRTMIAAFISAPENIRNLDKYKAIQARLADPRKVLGDAERDALIRDGKTVVAISCSIHSTEIVASQMSTVLAYNLASANDPDTLAILHNTILILIPSPNPDGVDIVTNWYRKTFGTPTEGREPPELYHHYAGHDDNRDWFMLDLKETKAITRLFWKEWFPEIVYDIHQQGSNGSRFFVPPFYDPPNPHIDALLLRQVGLIGNKMAADVTAAGFKGILTNALYDTWWHGGFRTAPYFHNSVGILTEASSARLMTPSTVTREQLARSSTRGMASALEATTNFPNPWPGGTWHPRDIMQMELIACHAVLSLASNYRPDYLRNFYELGKANLAPPASTDTIAYLIPAGQGHDENIAKMIGTLVEQGVEVYRLDHELHGTTGEVVLKKSPNGAPGIVIAGQSPPAEIPAGSYIIFLNQPYRQNVLALFEPQVYPNRTTATGEAERPYDVAGWTLPMQMGVETAVVRQPVGADQRAGLRLLERFTPPPGGVQGSGSVFVISHKTNASFKAINEILSAGGKVGFTEEKSALSSGSESQQSGNMIVSGIDRDRMNEIARKNSVIAQALAKAPEGVISTSKPRVGLYRAWVPVIDEGWTRWILENYGFAPATLRNGDVQAGHLSERFDAIILPDSSPRVILEGFAPGTIPGEYAGGLGEAGVESLREFTRRGGTLITFNNASLMAIESLGLPVANVLDGLKNDQFFCSGSLLNVELRDLNHPALWGMPQDPIVMFERGPAFEPKSGFQGVVLATYPKDRNPLASGYLLHPERIQGKAAALEVFYGRGRVYLFGFRPQWRGQSHGAYKLIFNAIYDSPSLARPTFLQKPPEQKPPDQAISQP